MNAAAQWMTIGSMVLCGLSMGTVFDVYRVAARRFHIARWMLPPLDLIYWAAATLCVFAVLLRYNHGKFVCSFFWDSASALPDISDCSADGWSGCRGGCSKRLSGYRCCCGGSFGCF
ncbi:hypothetical protein D3H35_23625 [Cohnella faecalis]|uniref:Spore cortex biosynthesis protein YabQ n=1 Tax=Cohnella faecalis TaxID=2315694 RepID=A0A398CR09_9BACL|nr:hypothetical protein D3H35_23625 [Cohnella faecalis]